MEKHEIERRIAGSKAMHERGFNCAQCVALSCCDLVGLDETVAFRMLEGFGGGMADHTQTCGALSGAVAVVSYARSAGPQGPISKFATYEEIKLLVDMFRTQAGSTFCCEIRGLTGGPVLRSCEDCIADGIRMTIDEIA